MYACNDKTFQNQTVIEPQDKFIYAGRFAPGSAYGEKSFAINKYEWPGYEFDEILSRKNRNQISEQSDIFLENDDEVDMDYIDEPRKDNWYKEDTPDIARLARQANKLSGPTVLKESKMGDKNESKVNFENFFK